MNCPNGHGPMEKVISARSKNGKVMDVKGYYCVQCRHWIERPKQEEKPNATRTKA